MKCIYCGKENDENFQFCQNCGRELKTQYETQNNIPLPTPFLLQKQSNKMKQSTKIRCHNCGYPNDIDYEKCKKCGYFLKEMLRRDRQIQIPTKVKHIKIPKPKFTSKVEAYLLLPNNNEIKIQDEGYTMFGRSDFAEYVSEKEADFITRVSENKYHFMIILNSNEFFIQDKNSSNGTLLNGSEIKGRGYIKLNDGDVINLAGVLSIEFMEKKI